MCQIKDVIRANPQSKITYIQKNKLFIPAGCVGFIRSGVIAVTKLLPSGDPQVLRLMRPGDVIGYLPENRDFVALTETVVHAVPARYLQGLDEAYVKVLQAEVNAITQILSISATCYTSKRLELALKLLGDYGVVPISGGVVRRKDLPNGSTSLLARLTSCDPCTVSRLLDSVTR